MSVPDTIVVKRDLELRGRRVRVHGLIRLYHGEPEIVIQEPSEVVPLE